MFHRVYELLSPYPLQTRFLLLVAGGGIGLFLGLIAAYWLWRLAGFLLGYAVLFIYYLTVHMPMRMSSGPRSMNAKIKADNRKAFVEGLLRFISYASLNGPNLFAGGKRVEGKGAPKPRWGRTGTAILIPSLAWALFFFFRIGGLTAGLDRDGSHDQDAAALRAYCAYEAWLISGNSYELGRIGSLKPNGELVVVVPDFQSLDWGLIRQDAGIQKVRQEEVVPLWPKALLDWEQPPAQTITAEEANRVVEDWRGALEKRDASALRDLYAGPVRYWQPSEFEISYRLPVLRTPTLPFYGASERDGTRLDSVSRMLQNRLSLLDPFRDQLDLDLAELADRTVKASALGEPRRQEDGTYLLTVGYSEAISTFLFDGTCTLRLVKTGGKIKILHEQGRYNGGSVHDIVGREFADVAEKFKSQLAGFLSGTEEAGPFAPSLDSTGATPVALTGAYLDNLAAKCKQRYNVTVTFQPKSPVDIRGKNVPFTFTTWAKLTFLFEAKPEYTHLLPFQAHFAGTFHWKFEQDGSGHVLMLQHMELEDGNDSGEFGASTSGPD
jgi:hypothetical protein